MTKIRLQADVEKAGDGKELVDERVADRRVDVGGDEEVLNRLQKFHREEEEHTRGEASVGSSGIDPVCREQTESCKSSGHFHREAHLTVVGV